MSKSLLALAAIFLLSASQCSDGKTVGRSDYGPFLIQSISNIVVAPLDCSVGPDEVAIGAVTMSATGAHVCTNKSACGDDYLKLFEFDLEIPHVSSESDDPTRPEFEACGREIEGTVVGTSGEGVETTIGILSVPEGEDLGCAILVDVQEMAALTDPRLRITVKNQGVLLGHEDYAPEQVVAEQAIVCE